MKTKDRLIVALDVPSFEEARKLIDTLDCSVNIYKVGIHLFTACGPVIVRYLLAQGKKVFLDLKFHDIPNTVANAVSSVIDLGTPAYNRLSEEGNAILNYSGELLMCTLHTLGGLEMMKRASSVLKDKMQKTQKIYLKLIGITVLTSEVNDSSIADIVLKRAFLAKQAGLDGIVASAQEAPLIRKEFGRDFIIITPGIRPVGYMAEDQKRVVTPSDAIKNGSNYLVVGRPIIKADDPLEVTEQILKEINLAVK